MNDPSLLQEFVLESYENLEQLDRDLVALESNPGDRERLSSVFRTVHNIKGSCSYFGFLRLEAVSHRGESLLHRLREGKLPLRPAITTALLALVDAVREMLGNIQRTGAEGSRDDTALLATLASLQEEPADGRAGSVGGRGSCRADGAGWTVGSAGASPSHASGSSVSPEPVSERPDHTAGVLEGSIRVDVGRLDKLMNLVGELVLARNQLLQLTTTHSDPAFLGTAQRLNQITTELQRGVMKTRMQPIDTVWSKLPRLARDLAVACGKQMTIGVEGADTEMDKNIIETIKDPLTHLIRNSIDHGIETPEVRRARGKPAEGKLFLRAFHEGGLVNIEVADDGGGIDPARVRQKALERGLLTEAQAARLKERDLLQLIFQPGFSTAEKVSSVSGRGVGMDVVKTNIESISGTVDLQSRPGLGTTVTIKLPLTLAILPALIVTSAGERYAIPQGNLLELVRLKEDAGEIERIHGHPVFRLRDKLLPLVYLNSELQVGAASRAAPDTGPARLAGPTAANVVVLQAGDQRFGLVVDGVHDTEEIVVKPLDSHLKSIPLFAGATILGDGKVVLILDVPGLARTASVVAEARDRMQAEKPAPVPRRPDARQSLLLLRLGNRRLAVPLKLVARLEELPPTAAEQAGRQEVVQYRGRILPLVRLAQMFPGGRGSEPVTASLQMVVCGEQGRQVGLVVDRILDVIEATSDLQLASRPVERTGAGDGTLGAAVLGQQVTDLLDVPGLIRAAYPDLPAPARAATRN